jgi:hypothetical protein
MGMKTVPLLCALFGFSLLFSSCIASPATLMPDTPVPPTATITPTATIVWFPPTSTPTLVPTLAITPTLDLKPKIGTLLFSDDFRVGTDWMLAQTNTSSIALGKNEITLAIAQPKTYLYTLRKEPQLDNFYLEINASPNLCLADDEYGILFRFTPNQEFYRLGLTCDGQIHLDRYMQNRAAMIYPKSYSGAVPPGAPSSSLIELWASKNQIIVFVNQQYQFTLNDAAIPAGSFGLFARTGSHDAMTVNFSDLKVYQIK